MAFRRSRRRVRSRKRIKVRRRGRAGRMRIGYRL